MCALTLNARSQVNGRLSLISDFLSSRGKPTPPSPLLTVTMIHEFLVPLRDTEYLPPFAPNTEERISSFLKQPLN